MIHVVSVPFRGRHSGSLKTPPEYQDLERSAARRPGGIPVQTLVDVQIKRVDRPVPIEVRIDIVIGIAH